MPFSNEYPGDPAWPGSVGRRFAADDCSGRIPGHTTRAPPVGLPVLCHCQLGQDIPLFRVWVNCRTFYATSRSRAGSCDGHNPSRGNRARHRLRGWHLTVGRTAPPGRAAAGVTPGDRHGTFACNLPDLKYAGPKPTAASDSNAFCILSPWRAFFYIRVPMLRKKKCYFSVIFLFAFLVIDF